MKPIHLIMLDCDENAVLYQSLNYQGPIPNNNDEVRFSKGPYYVVINREFEYRDSELKSVTLTLSDF